MHLIEKILKIEDEEVLLKVERLVDGSDNMTIEKNNFSAFAGMLSDKEADDFEKAIEEGCEIINADDWK